MHLPRSVADVSRFTLRSVPGKPGNSLRWGLATESSEQKRVGALTGAHLTQAGKSGEIKWLG